MSEHTEPASTEPDDTEPDDTESTSNTDRYRTAVSHLASALVEVWQVCEDGYDHHRGLGVKGNLPEALSYALGLAAVSLGLDRDDDGDPVEGERAQAMAAEALVDHRPGSWEAEHVRALTFPPDLIEHTTHPGLS